MDAQIKRLNCWIEITHHCATIVPLTKSADYLGFRGNSIERREISEFLNEERKRDKRKKKKKKKKRRGRGEKERRGGGDGRRGLTREQSERERERERGRAGTRMVVERAGGEA